MADITRHIPYVVVGNNFQALLMSLAYNAPFIYKINEFPLWRDKKELTAWEDVQILKNYGGGPQLTQHFYRRKNVFRRKLFYYEWFTFVASVGGLDITNGNCTDISFSDPNTIYLQFSNGSTMKIFYDKCFIMTQEGLRLDWESIPEYTEDIPIEVWDGWYLENSVANQPHIPRYFKNPDPKDNLVQFAVFPYINDKAGKHKWLYTHSSLTLNQLKNEFITENMLKKKIRKIIWKPEVGLQIRKGRKYLTIQHQNRIIKDENKTFHFYPNGCFPFDHNKMIVNWRPDQVMEHTDELFSAMEIDSASEPYWRRFLWLMNKFSKKKEKKKKSDIMELETV